MVLRGTRSETFRVIYEAYYGAIGAYARRRLDIHDADDLVADTFLVAWRRLEDIPEGEMALAWLYGVARRVLSQRHRAGRRRDRLLARAFRVGRPGEVVSPEVEGLSEQEIVQSALSMLRPGDQELLRLAEWEELTTIELARIFQCSTNAIGIRLHRAHRRLKEALRTVEADGAPAWQRENRYEQPRGSWRPAPESQSPSL